MKTLKVFNVQEMNINEMRTQNGGCDESYLAAVTNFYNLWKEIVGNDNDIIKTEIITCHKKLYNESIIL